MIIAVDLDDTLAESLPDFISFYKERYNISMKLEDFTSYTLNEINGMPVEEENKILEEFDYSAYYSELKPIAGAVGAIATLAKEHKIVIITARPEKFKVRTYEWVRKNFPMLNKIIFLREDYSCVPADKGVLCKRIEADVLIEDNLNNALCCARNGIKSILLNYPWNKTSETNALIERANSWGEILEIIQRFKSDKDS